MKILNLHSHWISQVRKMAILCPCIQLKWLFFSFFCQEANLLILLIQALEVTAYSGSYWVHELGQARICCSNKCLVDRHHKGLYHTHTKFDVRWFPSILEKKASRKQIKEAYQLSASTMQNGRSHLSYFTGWNQSHSPN